jgi:predicted metalloprotease with PDZ domain
VIPETNLCHKSLLVRHTTGQNQPDGAFAFGGRQGWSTTSDYYRLILLVPLLFTPTVARAAQPIHYGIDLTATEKHLVQVSLTIPDAGAGTEIQIPSWNCLYQIRDFVKNVEDMHGDCDGQSVDLEREDLNTWRGPNRSCGSLNFLYSVYADAEGPFDSILDGNHAFLNLAMVLFYLPRERQRPVQVKFQIPSGWKLATLMDGEDGEFHAANYDALVDSPVEAGHFKEFSYAQDFTPLDAPAPESKRATIRLIIDAERSDYSPGRIVSTFQKITAEETNLMQDLPFRVYTFLLHFPREGGSTGGMEHRNGTAISIPASEVGDNESYLESVAAHEFFHLWNVKRIRPQAMEPIDYIRGNDTRDLWFCEGVTNTYAEMVLLRTGLIDRENFYERVAGAIQVLQSRSARRFQSAEMSGREAWLEKYPEYNRSERSISYYNKGEILGYLLDLDIRHATQNQAGLDEVMRRLNQEFGRTGRFYTLADVTATVGQLAPSFDINRFVADDVRGTQELDYASSLGYAGLRLATQTSQVPVQGFSASRNDGGRLQVDSVDTGSDAERAGVQPGDVLLMANGDPLPAGPSPVLPAWRPGQEVELQINRSGETRVLKLRIGVNQEVSVRIEEDSQATRGQRRVREGWLTGTTNSLVGKP